MIYLPTHRRRCPARRVVHHIVCQHQVEIEVWPANAEVYFQDERHVDPVNTQLRFHAAVYNAPSARVLWEVIDGAGGSGAGSMDPGGLYLAPPKGTIPSGTTDIVVATAADDPLRKAFARVTLVGFGPEPALVPKLEIFPRQTYLYYKKNQTNTKHHNEFIDVSNKMQLFRAMMRHTDSTQVKWSVNSGPVGTLEPWYLYQAPEFGTDGQQVKVEAKLSDNEDIRDEARIVLINYTWPGIV